MNLRRPRWNRSLWIITMGFLLAGAYIVKKHDTMWDISGTYLQDPFRWPDLWSKNQHIQDPHWIYPGDSLVLPGQNDSLDLSKLEPKEIPNDSNLPSGIHASAENTDRSSSFAQALGNLSTRLAKDDSPRGENRYDFRDRNPPAIFNVYYQLLAPQLHDLDQFQRDPRWFDIRSGDIAKAQNILIHANNEILIYTGKKKSSIQPGDRVEIHLMEKVHYWNHPDSSSKDRVLSRLVGFAQVESVGDTLSRAIVLQTMKDVRTENTKVKLFSLPPLIQVKDYEEVPDARYENMAIVKYIVDPRITVGPYQYILINQSTSQGMKPGTAVAIWEDEILDPSLPPRLLGRGIVVSSGSSEACVMVRELYSPSRRLAIGNRVSVTHRAMTL